MSRGKGRAPMDKHACVRGYDAGRALLVASHAEGSVLNLRATRKGIRHQAQGLGKKILEVERLLWRFGGGAALGEPPG